MAEIVNPSDVRGQLLDRRQTVEQAMVRAGRTPDLGRLLDEVDAALARLERGTFGICERCGKVGTTIVTAWDGERVHYECRPRLVEWATGCGNEGWVSPFGGRAKLPWNPTTWSAMRSSPT